MAPTQRCTNSSHARRLGRFLLTLITVLAIVDLLSLEPLLAQANFYQGKTIRMIVGFQAGDNHDIWMRFYARFHGKQITGNPDFVEQKIPGAGVMIAANNIYN